MCRFVTYLGDEIPLSHLVTLPTNSLIRQSHHARERSEPLNGDGFGLGWYTPNETSEPALFKSISPAWSNRNLADLASHTRSGCFFAHIRAASPGTAVSEANCHPFRIGKFLWMHNGSIDGFKSMRRRLCSSLPDSLYNSIEGTTDSEHAFAVFMNLVDGSNDLTAHELGDGLVRTVSQLEQWSREVGATTPSIYNFAVTDGRSIAAIRYVSDPNVEQISLYFSNPGEYCCRDGQSRINCSGSKAGIIVASERLTDNREDWIRVAPNHVLTIDTDLESDVWLV